MHSIFAQSITFKNQKVIDHCMKKLGTYYNRIPKISDSLQWHPSNRNRAKVRTYVLQRFAFHLMMCKSENVTML